jgi:hypothetical protein
MRNVFVGPRGETAIGDGQPRDAAEERNVTIQGRRPEGALSLAVLAHSR